MMRPLCTANMALVMLAFISNWMLPWIVGLINVVAWQLFPPPPPEPYKPPFRFLRLPNELQIGIVAHLFGNNVRIIARAKKKSIRLFVKQSKDLFLVSHHFYDVATAAKLFSTEERDVTLFLPTSYDMHAFLSFQNKYWAASSRSLDLRVLSRTVIRSVSLPLACEIDFVRLVSAFKYLKSIILFGITHVLMDNYDNYQLGEQMARTEISHQTVWRDREFLFEMASKRGLEVKIVFNERCCFYGRRRLSRVYAYTEAVFDLIKDEYYWIGQLRNKAMEFMDPVAVANFRRRQLMEYVDNVNETV